MKKLQTSGYDKKFRLEILKSIIKAWKSILEKDRTGERPLHRPRNFMKAERKNEKNDKKLNWFKGRNGNTFSSVLMVPITPNGELKKSIEEKAKAANLKVKIVEKAGPKLGGYLRKYDKTKLNETCKQKDFLICSNATKNSRKCRVPSVVYKISCKECLQHGIKSNYYGETKFNGYSRGLQHQEKYKSKNLAAQEKSAMRQHAIKVHNDNKVSYKMEIIKSFKNNPLPRQVLESVHIINSKNEDDHPMNSKQEFNQALVVTAKFTKGIFE